MFMVRKPFECVRIGLDAPEGMDVGFKMGDVICWRNKPTTSRGTIMFTVQIPKDHPLTNEKDAQEVFLVMDLNAEIGGVYPTVDRAFAYIANWESQAGRVITDFELLACPSKQVWQVRVDGVTMYYIYATTYRQ